MNSAHVSLPDASELEILATKMVPIMGDLLRTEMNTMSVVAWLHLASVTTMSETTMLTGLTDMVDHLDSTHAEMMDFLNNLIIIEKYCQLEGATTMYPVYLRANPIGIYRRGIVVHFVELISPIPLILTLDEGMSHDVVGTIRMNVSIKIFVEICTMSVVDVALAHNLIIGH